MKKVWLSILIVASICFGVDNASLKQDKLLTYQKTYGVVFLIPQVAIKQVKQKTQGLLSETLLQNNLLREALTYNMPHISVLHIHNPDPKTPYKILKALPKPPKPFSLYLNHYVFIKASPHSKSPWWVQLGVEKDLAYQTIMQYNYEVVKNIAPLRATPLPSSTGYIYQDLSQEAKSQVEDLGSSGLNRIKNGKKEEFFRPHMTLLYSPTPLDEKISASIKALQKELDTQMKTPIKADFNTISIVELGFLGNVLREIYRIDLGSGKIYDVEQAKFINKP